MKPKELAVAPLCEALLLFIVGAAGWLTHKPLLFASLGPTAYELIEQPERPSARPYNVIVGHLVAVAAGFAALGITHAWQAPPISSGSVAGARLWAGVLAAALTVLVTLLLKATQPAALSTALLLSLGTLQSHGAAIYVMAAVILMVLVGEPLRRWRVRQRKQEAIADCPSPAPGE